MAAEIHLTASHKRLDPQQVTLMKKFFFFKSFISTVDHRLQQPCKAHRTVERVLKWQYSYTSGLKPVVTIIELHTLTLWDIIGHHRSRWR